jgi:hypothetical protein
MELCGDAMLVSSGVRRGRVVAAIGEERQVEMVILQIHRESFEKQGALATGNRRVWRYIMPHL